MWRIFGGLLVAGVGIALPLTLKPSAPALAALWVFCFLCLLGMVLTSPPVATRTWSAVAERVKPHLTREQNVSEMRRASREVRAELKSVRVSLAIVRGM